MSFRFTLFAALLTIFPAGLFAVAQSPFAGNVPPLSWVSQLLPENVPEPQYPDYDANNPLEKARIQMLAGQYRRSLITLDDVPPRKAVDISLIRGESLLALGRWEEALAALTSPDPAVQTLRARVQAAQGNFQDAVATLRAVIAAHPSLIPPHYYLGAYLESLGNFHDARAAYDWFTSGPTNFLEVWNRDPDSFTSPEDVTLIGRAIDRWATLNLKYQENKSLSDTIENMFVRSYDLIDRGYWQGHVASAEYFLLHDDPEQAMAELKLSLDANPFDVQSWTLVGQICLEEFNFDGADQAIDHIRQVNPDSIDADILQARNLLAQRAPKQALPPLQRVLGKQPHNIEALGLLAGTYALLLQDDRTAQILAQVSALSPSDPVAYEEVAEQMSGMRQYPRATEMYKEAIARAPWWTSAHNGLGLLYTQSGDEDSARKELEEAHELDPYCLETTNYLRLLDMMQHFARRESAHFIVLYDPQADPVIPEYFSDYLESIYPQVCGDYNFEPKQKTMIEVFPTHDAFSVRTTGTPWIATVGASTGRVIALVAPRKGEATMGPFNWSQVLHHEFTHTVTLGATDNRIPLWFTEGLAVTQEHAPMQWTWIPMLNDAVQNRTLFTLDAITWGFVRPRRPIDRQLAYAESTWICKFIEETYGHPAILAMIDQFRLGRVQEDIFPIVFHKNQDEFYSDFQAWCQKQVAGWGYDPVTTEKYESLRAQGESLIRSAQYAQAVPIYEQLAVLRPVDLLPHKVLAGLYMTKQVNLPRKSAEQLVILARVELMNNLYARGAAKRFADLGDYSEAAKWALKAVFIDPYDVNAHKQLADIDEKIGDTAGLARERRVLDILAHWSEPADSPGQSAPAGSTPAGAAPAGSPTSN